MVKLLLALTVLIIAAGLWVRISPSDPVRWNKTLDNPIDQARMGSVVRVLSGRSVQIAELEAIIKKTPRTKLLAGSVDEGQFTYVTRSLYWGFPDYATVWVDDSDLIIYSRLRFGRGDYGVNKTRVDGWVERLPNP